MSEVPQGNQDGRINNSRHGYREMCDGATILKPNAFYMGSDGGKYYTCSKCGDPITDPIEYLEAKRKGSDLSAADLGHTEGTNTSQSSDSQDSIDTREALDALVREAIIFAINGELSQNVFAVRGTRPSEAVERTTEAILAWHNTQLKAAIPEKRRTEPGHTERQLPSDVLQRWQNRQMAYNQAIDDMQANLEET